MITYLINKYLTKNPEKTSVGFRKFVIYLTIFLSCAMIITDLIVLLRYFLNGEITFGEIIESVENGLSYAPSTHPQTLGDILAIDEEIRKAIDNPFKAL